MRYQKGMKTRKDNHNHELDWTSLYRQTDEFAQALREELMPEEPNRGPYRLFAYRQSQSVDGEPAFEEKTAGPFPTLDDIMKKTVGGRMLGYRYSIRLQDGATEIAALIENDWTVYEQEEVDAVPAQPDKEVVFRAAVMALARQGRENRPELAARLDRAVSIVLNGEYEEQPNGDFTIRSQSRGNITYSVNGTCGCEHYQYRGRKDSWCTQRLARMLVIRAREEMQEEGR